MGTYVEHEGTLDASGMRIAIVAGRFNDHVTKPLLEGALATLDSLAVGGAAEEVAVWWVPGAFEMPLAAQALAPSHDAVICLGAVIRGDTPHFDYVAGECAAGIQRVALDTRTPVVFGVLTTENLDQCIERTGGAEGHKGAEAARTAVEMVTLLRELAATPMVAPPSGTKGS
jgi:6,7-dimethyl-8-ribityllumazine synthase